MLNMTYFTFPLFFILLWLVVFCSFCVAYGLCYCAGIKTKNKTEPVLSTTKQIQETHNFKINLTLLILWSWKIVPGCKLKHFTVLSTVQKYDKSPKTSFSVSAVLASLNLVLWIPNLHPCDSGAGWGDEWLKPPTPPPPIFILLYGGNTISSDRHWLCVEFPLIGVWMQSQPSVKDKQVRKLNNPTIILFKWNIYAPILKLPADKVLCGSCMWWYMCYS